MVHTVSGYRMTVCTTWGNPGINTCCYRSVLPHRFIHASSFSAYSERILKLATNISRDKLVSVGTCFGKFTKTNKFRLHITALDFLAPYAKVTMGASHLCYLYICTPFSLLSSHHWRQYKDLVKWHVLNLNWCQMMVASLDIIVAEIIPDDIIITIFI